MTGPGHYYEAERLIAAVTLSGTHPDGSPIIRSDEPQTIALAQVHATLALAAATAELDAYNMMDGAATGRSSERADRRSDVIGDPQPQTGGA